MKYYYADVLYRLYYEFLAMASLCNTMSIIIIPASLFQLSPFMPSPFRILYEEERRRRATIPMIYRQSPIINGHARIFTLGRLIYCHEMPNTNSLPSVRISHISVIHTPFKNRSQPQYRQPLPLAFYKYALLALVTLAPRKC